MPLDSQRLLKGDYCTYEALSNSTNSISPDLVFSFESSLFAFIRNSSYLVTMVSLLSHSRKASLVLAISVAFIIGLLFIISTRNATIPTYLELKFADEDEHPRLSDRCEDSVHANAEKTGDQRDPRQAQAENSWTRRSDSYGQHATQIHKRGSSESITRSSLTFKASNTTSTQAKKMPTTPSSRTSRYSYLHRLIPPKTKIRQSMSSSKRDCSATFSSSSSQS